MGGRSKEAKEERNLSIAGVEWMDGRLSEKRIYQEEMFIQCEEIE